MLKLHDHMLDFVDDLLHGVLSASDAETVQRHCDDCRICQVALDEARERQRVIGGISQVEVPEQLIRSTLEGIDAYERGTGRVRRIVVRAFWAVSAAAALLLAVTHIYFANLQPSPYNLLVLGQSAWMPDSAASLCIRLVNHTTNAAVADAPVEISLVGKQSRQIVRLASVQTDASGLGRAQFRLPDWAEGDYELRVRARPGGEEETIARQISLRRSWRLMLTSDKPIYQPGQTIHLRSLALRRPDAKPVAETEALFSIVDPKGNTVFKYRAATSKFGIASCDCPLAGEIIEGRYQLRCKIGDTESATAVDVRHYVLPKVSVHTELDRPFYEPGQRVHGTVTAKYFFGKPVAAGRVKVVWQSLDAGSATREPMVATADKDGRAQFEFSLPQTLVGRPQDSGDARINLNVTVTDDAGQEASETLSRIVTAKPLRIEIVPEGGKFVRDVPNRIFVLATDPEGRPVQAKVRLAGRPDEIQTDEHGLASFEITPHGNVNLKVSAVSDRGQTVEREVRLGSGDFDDYLVRLNKSVYQSGDTMHLTVLGRGSEPVFVDLAKDHQTISTHLVQLNDGRGELEIDPSPELAGSLQLCAYRFSENGFPVSKTRALYVQPADQIHLTLAMDRDEYRPGQQARLEMNVTDRSGKPKPGAVSLAAVDEAVFAVSNNSPGMESTFFHLDQELLKPVCTAYAWDPNDNLSSDDATRWQQALFTRTWKTDERSQMLKRLQQDPELSGISFDVLNRGDVDKLMEYFPPDEQKRLQTLAHGTSLHSLAAASFPESASRAAATQRTGLKAMETSWWIFIVAFVILGGVLLSDWHTSRGGRFPTIVEVLVIVVIITVLCSLLMPAVQSAREASNRNSVQNEMKQIGLALMNYEDKRHGLSPIESPLAEPSRVREWFPETLLWRPEIITDDHGHASIDVPLADSITTWRLSASAVGADGSLGAANSRIRVFQPFFVDLNLPVAITRGDEISIPVVVYNYLDKPQSVELKLASGDWYELSGDSTRQINLKPHEVHSESFRLHATKAGKFTLEVSARSSQIADAIRRQLEVVPDGRPVEKVFNGVLNKDAQAEFEVPAGTIDGSLHATLKLYPTTFSQVVEGLDSILQMPYGCFEQTSSTTYPNILALDYLRTTNRTAPAVEAKARQYLHLGYQRLLSFEIAGGGFDWFGRPPANRMLSAYGLAEFTDMARVYDVDPAVIKRTREYLLRQQNADGSWDPEQHAMHDDPSRRSGVIDARLATSAYIAAAVFAGQGSDEAARRSENYLISHPADTIDDPYLLGLVSNAFLALDPASGRAQPYIARLERLKRSSDDGKFVWWEPGGRSTLFYGAGASGQVEATALAVQALIGARSGSASVPPAMAWLVAQKDAAGTWHSTQATVLALRALLAATGKPLGGDRERQIEITLDGAANQQVTIPADQADVVQQIDLSDAMHPGRNRIQLRNLIQGDSGYQFVLRYNVPGSVQNADSTPFSIEVTYDQSKMNVGDKLAAKMTLTNRTSELAPMVLVDIPIPAGFELATDDLARLVANGTIAKFQITPRSAIVYLKGVEPQKSVVLSYHLHATMPVRVTIPGVTAYEYYDPTKRITSSIATVSANR